MNKSCYLFISTLEHLPWGGCEELWFKTALLALQDKEAVYVLVFRHKNIPAHLQQLIDKGARVFYLSRVGANTSLFNRGLKKIFSIHPHQKELVELQKKINEYSSVNVLISQAGGFDFAYGYLDELKCWITKRGFSCNIVVQNVADIGCTLSVEEGLKQQEMYDAAMTVGFVSERNRLSSERILAGKIPNAYLTTNPLNFATTPAYIEYPKNTATVEFAVVAALRCFHKGQDVLFQVLAGEEWENRKWNLNLYGKGPDEAYLHKLAGFYKISDRIFFHGHVDDISQIWEKNHIHILPSLGEGTPLALIESMLCGRTVVTTDVGGNAEYAEQMVSGFVINYPTFPALKKGMEFAWGNQDKWEPMGKDARKAIVNSYDLNPQRKLYRILQGSVEKIRIED